MSKAPNFIVLTGGHHTSGLAVALALKSAGWHVAWLGHRHSSLSDKNDSLEYQEVTAAGISFYNLLAGKFYRSHPLYLLRLPYGFFQALYLLITFLIHYRSSFRGVVTFGGYLGVPVTLAAWLLRIPVISHEQTLSPGYANRFISFFAKKIALTWPESTANFPSSKTVLTGLPLREEFVDLKPHPSHTDYPQVYITGGKQGSHAINSAVFTVLTQLLCSYTIVHQTGSNSYFDDYHLAQRLKEKLPKTEASRYQIYSHLSSPQAATTLSQSAAVISRSGAHIIYELALLGIPSLLIPLPNSSHKEQEKNATYLAKHNLALVISQDRLTGDKLLELLPQVINRKTQAITLPQNGTQQLVQLIKQVFK